MLSTKAKINKQNTRHGKMDMPVAALNKYAGMAKGGDVKKEMKAAGIFAKAGERKLAAHERREAMGKEKDTPAIAKKEMSVLKKSKAPKDVMDYEKAEHKSMGFARGGGIESKGKTKVKRYNGIEDGSEVENDNTDAEGYGTKLEGKSNAQPKTFAQAFREARAKGAGTEFMWNGKKIAAYREGEEPESWKKSKAKPAESKPVASKPAESKPAESKPTEATSSSKPSADKLAMARAQGGYPDYTDKDVRKGAVEGTLKGAELASLATGLGGAGRAALGAVRAGLARAGQRAASRAGVQAFKDDVMAQRSKKDIMEGMDKLRAERNASAKASSEGMKSGGSVKKFAKGGGIESRGKTRGRFI